MNARALVLAVLFALVGVSSLFIYMRRVEAEASGGDKISVLMLAKPVKKGAMVLEDQLAVREVPMAYVDDRVVRANDKGKVLGVRVERALEPEQLLQWNDLSVSGDEDRHLSQLVQPGSRALTLHIPAQYLSVEMLRPGDYVDLLAILPPDEGRGSPQSVILMQKVLVLAVGEDMTPTREARTAGTRFDQLLTLSVTLQESQLIALAAQKGPITAVLRSPDDPSVAEKVPALSQVALREAPAGVAVPVRGRGTARRPEKLKSIPLD